MFPEGWTGSRPQGSTNFSFRCACGFMVSTGLIFELWFSGFPHSMVSEFPCRADEHSGKTMMIIMVLRGVFQCKAERVMTMGLYLPGYVAR